LATTAETGGTDCGISEAGAPAGLVQAANKIENMMNSRNVLFLIMFLSLWIILNLLY
jgi:hypothetical protein